MLRDYMCAMLNAFLPDAVYAMVENGRILGLLRLGGARHEPGSVLSTLRESPAADGICGGLSTPFSRLGGPGRLSDPGQLYRQAVCPFE